MNKDSNKNYTVATIASLLLHSALIGGLLWGADITRVVQPPQGESIKAVVVDPAAVREQARKIREQRQQVKQQEEGRLRRLEQQAQRLEKQREQEERRIRELKAKRLASEKAARVAEAERKRSVEAKQKAEKSAKLAKEAAEKAKKLAAKAEADRQRKLAEKQQAEQAAKQAEKARKQKLVQQKKAEDDARKAETSRKDAARKAEAVRKEAELKVAEAAEAKRQQQEQDAALDNIFNQLESESQTRTSAKGQRIIDEANQWGAKFESMIQQNWLVDSSMNSQTCRLKLRLAADGFVIDVSTLSGDAPLCRSATASVFKVNKFPMPSDPDVVDKLRDLNLNFER